MEHTASPSESNHHRHYRRQLKFYFGNRWAYDERVYRFTPLAEVDSIAQMTFISLDKLDLYKLSPDEYEPGAFYRPMFSEQMWAPLKFDNILRDIAYDNLRAFFISMEKDIMIAPYDGGVDFILKNSVTRDIYKEKYISWLSPRQDGL